MEELLGVHCVFLPSTIGSQLDVSGSIRIGNRIWMACSAAERNGRAEAARDEEKPERHMAS